MSKEQHGRALFNIQRFIILQSKQHSEADDIIPDEYAYAWYVKLYPSLSTGELHKNFESFFSVSKEKVDAVSDYLDREWLDSKYYTFNGIENHFKTKENHKNIDRNDLIRVLRYLYLNDYFDDFFWEKLLETDSFPIEASKITSKFNSSEFIL